MKLHIKLRNSSDIEFDVDELKITDLIELITNLTESKEMCSVECNDNN